jgi:hypothetical protein
MVRQRRERSQLFENQMAELQWDIESRIARVRELAARLYGDVREDVQGLPVSVREAMHALALTTSAVIRTHYRGRGVESAIEQHIVNVRHHARKGQ